MKKVNAVKYFAGTALAVAISSAAVAEPTRGFSIEHGTIAEKGAVSVELADGVNGFDAGARVGFGNAEFVINSGQVGVGDQTDAIIKIGLPALEGLSELNHSWSVFGGWSVYKNEVSSNNKEKYNSFSAGVAFSAEVEKLSFTVTPVLIVDGAVGGVGSASQETKTYMNIGMGAYFDLGETAYGSFKPGVEVVTSTLSGEDTVLNIGVRWGVNERVNVDLVPLRFDEEDTLSLPGQFRLNAAF